MRLFLAIELPDKNKLELEEQLTEMKKEHPEFNWVSPENFHITIHFFGETDKVQAIKKRIEDLMFDQEIFYLYSTNADVFANNKLVVYLNFRREKRIEELAEKITSNFEQNIFNDRKFIPHLSLARGKKSSKQQYFVLKKRLNKLSIDLAFKVRKIFLFESILDGKKPIYKKIASFSLINN